MLRTARNIRVKVNFRFRFANVGAFVILHLVLGLAAMLGHRHHMERKKKMRVSKILKQEAENLDLRQAKSLLASIWYNRSACHKPQSTFGYQVTPDSLVAEICSRVSALNSYSSGRTNSPYGLPSSPDFKFTDLLQLCLQLLPVVLLTIEIQTPLGL